MERWQVLWCVQLNELSQEVILWLLIVTDDVFDHHNGVVGVGFLVDWQELR
jgi:hypothetical protein